MKKPPYICWIYLGDTTVDIHGYGREVEYAYIGDEDVTEMMHQLNAWDLIKDRAYAERPWENAE